MPTLLDQPDERIEALKIAAVDSLPTVAPHYRHKPRNTTRDMRLMAICTALIVVGVVLRAWQLDQVPGVNGDEAWYGVQSQRFLDEYVVGKELPIEERVNFRTPTGNVWNPFLMIPRILLDATLEPSVWSLRCPALISGVLTLLLNWWHCRRAFERSIAWLTTTLLAILPVTMIYSRLGWDTCQSVLFCLPLVYLPLITQREATSGLRTAVYFGLALAAVLLVHPTNIFLAPLVGVLLWPRISTAQLERLLRTRGIAAVTACCLALFIGILRGAWTGVEPSNLISVLGQWAGDVAGLFNGATVYGSISLPAEELPAAQRWLMLLSLPTLAILVWTRLLCKTPLFSRHIATLPQRYAAVFDGTCLAALCFLGVAGPAAIQPGYERYGLWLIAPGVLLIVLAYLIAARSSRHWFNGVTILAVAQIGLLLAGYWQYYQRRFDVPAAEQRLAHWTYRADNYGSWFELDRELFECFEKASLGWPRYILIDPADPQRWWFEWKWRYLSRNSRVGYQYHWLVMPFEDAQTLSGKENHVWQMHSNSKSEKEKLSIQNRW